jgi:vesicle-associated membrane protein 72
MSKTKGDEKIELLKKQTEELKQIMIDNVNKAVIRGDQLSDMDKKSENLVIQSKLFEQNSSKLKRLMCWKNAKGTICIVLIIAVVIGIIVAIIYATKS